MANNIQSAIYFNNYTTRLKNMDWFYEYSDDFQVWNRGKTELLALYEIASKIDKNFIHWNHYCTNDELKQGAYAEWNM